VNRRLAIAAVCLSLATGLVLFGEQGYIAAKARYARHLIDHAYAAYLEDGHPHRPWSWADMHPVARLELPRLGIESTILSGASGASLAFGPGHIDGTAAPNAPGNSVVAGHRDSWFRFLGDVRTGDLLWVETREGRIPYEVTSRSVRSSWEGEAVLAARPHRTLTLVTCWPLDDLLPGPGRLVVVAEAIGSRSSRRAPPRRS
jgi:sortase A